MIEITNELTKLLNENRGAPLIPVAEQSFEVEAFVGLVGKLTKVSLDRYIVYDDKVYLESNLQELYDDYYNMHDESFDSNASDEDINRTIRFLFASQWKTAIACYMEPYGNV